VRPVAKSLLTLVFFSLRQFPCTSDIYCWSICWAVLCFAGWILCCPCWTLGYCLRNPPSYYYYYDYDHQHPQHYHHRQQQQAEMLDDDEELPADPCWPCDRRRNTNTRRPHSVPLSIETHHRCSDGVPKTDDVNASETISQSILI